MDRSQDLEVEGLIKPMTLLCVEKLEIKEILVVYTPMDF